MVSESLVQTTSLERQMAVAVAERATERDSGTHMTHICVYMCVCVCEICMLAAQLMMLHGYVRGCLKW